MLSCFLQIGSSQFQMCIGEGGALKMRTRWRQLTSSDKSEGSLIQQVPRRIAGRTTDLPHPVMAIPPPTHLPHVVRYVRDALLPRCRRLTVVSQRVARCPPALGIDPAKRDASCLELASTLFGVCPRRDRDPPSRATERHAILLGRLLGALFGARELRLHVNLRHIRLGGLRAVAVTASIRTTTTPHHHAGDRQQHTQAMLQHIPLLTRSWRSDRAPKTPRPSSTTTRYNILASLCYEYKHLTSEAATRAFAPGDPGTVCGRTGVALRTLTITTNHARIARGEC